MKAKSHVKITVNVISVHISKLMAESLIIIMIDPVDGSSISNVSFG